MVATLCLLQPWYVCADRSHSIWLDCTDHLQFLHIEAVGTVAPGGPRLSPQYMVFHSDALWGSYNQPTDFEADL